MLHALCSASNLRAREKRRKTSVQADSQGHVSPVSRAYDVLFGLSTLISNRILFHNLCEIEYPASGTLEHDWRRRYADVPFPRATKEIGDVCTQAIFLQFHCLRSYRNDSFPLQLIDQITFLLSRQMCHVKGTVSRLCARASVICFFFKRQ